MTKLVKLKKLLTDVSQHLSAALAIADFTLNYQLINNALTKTTCYSFSTVKVYVLVVTLSGAVISIVITVPSETLNIFSER